MVKYCIPNDVNEALTHLNQGGYKVIAGGTDMMIQSRSWSETPPKFIKNMIYILNLKELNYYKTINNHLEIGAVTPYETLLDADETPKLFKEILLELASPALRYVGTLAGNIGNASPAADALVGLYVYDAMITLERLNQQRHVPIKDVIIGPKQTAIDEREMITKISLPILKYTHTSWVKVGGRRADAISKVSFAGLANIEAGVIKDLRIALGAVNATVVRERTIEERLIGKTVDDLDTVLEEVVQAYRPFIQPIDDQRSNAIYRKNVSLGLIEAFLKSLKKG